MDKADEDLLFRHFDGETSPAEEEAAEELLRHDPEAAALLEKWTAERQALQETPPTLTEPEVEMDWERLKAQILIGEEEPEKPSVINWRAWSRSWIWAAAAAVLVLASVVFFLPRSHMPDPVNTTRAPANVVDAVETDINGATPIVFVDAQTGWSVVWVDEAAAG